MLDKILDNRHCIKQTGTQKLVFKSFRDIMSKTSKKRIADFANKLMFHLVFGLQGQHANTITQPCLHNIHKILNQTQNRFQLD